MERGVGGERGNAEGDRIHRIDRMKGGERGGVKFECGTRNSECGKEVRRAKIKMQTQGPRP